MGVGERLEQKFIEELRKGGCLFSDEMVDAPLRDVLFALHEAWRRLAEPEQGG